MSAKPSAAPKADAGAGHPTRPGRGRAALGRSVLELFASMRFAIVLLGVLAVASVIGTVLPQRGPAGTYVETFGPFWSQVFLTLQLDNVYSAWWFVLILAFLVASTSLCLLRNTPRYLADMRRFQEHLRVSSFRAMPWRAQASLPGTLDARLEHLSALLRSRGWRLRLQPRAAAAGTPAGCMLAAKKGSANKLGYIATHGAIVLICLGGLLDSSLLIQARLWLYPAPDAAARQPGMVARLLGPGTLSYRGHLLVSEGASSDQAVLNLGGRLPVLQQLPFSIALRHFEVSYYENGMPRMFASDVVIHDHASGTATPHRIEVNHPLRVDGVDIYQSGFEDGGSELSLQPFGLRHPLEMPALHGRVGSHIALPASAGGEPMTLELLGLQVHNVENLAAAHGHDATTDGRRPGLGRRLEQALGASDRSSTPARWQDIGPSVTYRLRDAAGQAIEFRNYMHAADLGDGVPVYLLGVRPAGHADFLYLRIPQDPEGSMRSFLALLHALDNAGQREHAARLFARQMIPASRPLAREQLERSAAYTLALFAGAAPAGQPPGGPDTAHTQPDTTGGLAALAGLLESAAADHSGQQHAAGIVLRILNGALFELLQQSRAEAHLPPMDPAAPASAEFMQLALFSLGDARLYPAPVFFELTHFRQVQASVFQVTRSPGRSIVYLGSLLLVAGIMLMLFVRECRLWIWLAPAEADPGQERQAAAPDALTVQIAMSSNRRTLASEQEFAQLCALLLEQHQEPEQAPPAPPAATRQGTTP